MVKVLYPCGRTVRLCAQGISLFIKYKWKLCSNNNGRYYLGYSNMIFPRILLNAPKNLAVDHINRNSLDNRVINLRICTNSENMSNRSIFKNKTHGRYKGVRFDASKRGSKKWGCRITKNGRRRSWWFKTEVEAARHYNKMALELHGVYAALNVLEEDL